MDMGEKNQELVVKLSDSQTDNMRQIPHYVPIGLEKVDSKVWFRIRMLN